MGSNLWMKERDGNWKPDHGKSWVLDLGFGTLLKKAIPNGAIIRTFFFFSNKLKLKIPKRFQSST